MSTIKITLWLLLLIPSLLVAKTWQAQSSDSQIAVMELFTSEGCGLCPAADTWVKSLTQQGVGKQQLIILGFHIDYLNDKKAWIDQFASPVFSDRQRQLARLNLYQSIYTPEFVISGEIIHNWRQHVKKVVKAVNSFEPEANINLEIKQHQQQLVITSDIKISGADNRQYAKLYLAVVENNLISKVSGGDNAGTTFNHQHLVRQWLGPIDLDQSGNSHLSTSITINEQWDFDNLSIVAVVQNLEDSFVLQGLELPLQR